MSTEILHHPDSKSLSWQGHEDRNAYVFAHYLICTSAEPEAAALGIAREQSLCADAIAGVSMPPDLDQFKAKLVAWERADDAPAIASPYTLNTPVYGAAAEQSPAVGTYRIVIAYPIVLFGSGMTRMWNIVFGEVHRLGYLLAARLERLELPESFASTFPGPRYGIEGLRNLLGVAERPIFCRSMRPASGVTTDQMLSMNDKVLRGGFDVIKDDELTYDNERSPFAERMRRMVDLKKRIEDETGERKLYFANAIDDLDASLRLAEMAAELGADGVLVSIHAQGLSIISEVARRTQLAILSHNTCGDALTRAAGWGAGDAVMALVQRAVGADLVVSPGPFATRYQDPGIAHEFLQACRGLPAGWRQSMPIIQGGKRPEHLADYIEHCESTDFMIIAATWVDEHPEGMETGARQFRDAWEALDARSAPKALRPAR